MKKTWTRGWIPGLVLWTSVASAGSGGQQRPAEPNRADVEGMMEAYVLNKLQDSLDLSDEQFGSLVVAQKKLQDTRRSYRQDRMGVLRKLRQTLRFEQAGEGELGPLLDELDVLRDDFATDEKTRYEAIDAILDIRQRARYRILEVELQRRLNEMMRDVRGRRQNGELFEE